MVLDLKQIRERGFSLRLAWDLFMILIAVINVLLIGFDWTYFYLRPYLFAYSPIVVEIYDPVKGVEDDPQTREYLNRAERYFEADQAAEREALAGELIELSRSFAENNPFAESGQSANLRRAADAMREYAGGELPPAEGPEPDRGFSGLGIFEDARTPKNSVPAFATASEAFWTAPDSAKERAAYFRERVRPLFEMNFERRRDLSGRYEDHFLRLDAPFLIVFLIEFLVRWFLAVRRRTLVRWWLFPIYNWYDVLGLIPFAEFRIFRLFRVLSIYVRLHRSDLTKVGDDFISRAVKSYSAIITEEISDRVAARILSEMQDEIKSGASIDIFLRALEPRREELKTLIVGYVQRMSAQRPGQERTRQLLGKSLEDAARRVPSLQFVPDFIKERLTREIGVAVFDGINDTLAESLDGDRGEEIIGEIVNFVLDDIMKEGRGSPADELFRAISLDALENMKSAVNQKKWARNGTEDG